MNNKFKIGKLLSGYTFKDSYNKKSFGISGAINGLSFNTVQGYNFSLGLNFTKRYNDYKNFISFDGLLNYSFETERLRAGVKGTYKFNAINNAELSVSAGTKTEQFNSEVPISRILNSISSLFFEKNFMKLYDRTFTKVNYSMALFNGFSFSSSLSYEKRNALFNTTDFVLFPKADVNYSSNNPLNPDGFGTAAFLNHNLL